MLKTKSVLVAAMCLLLVACSVSAVVVDIQIATDIVVVGAPVVAAFAGPGAQAAVTYMQAAGNGLNCTLAAAQAAGATTATIGAAFGTCFAQAVVPVLPAGTPLQVAAVITAAAAAINLLVQKYGPKAALAASQPGKPVHLSFGDRRKAGKIQRDLAGALAKLRK